MNKQQRERIIEQLESWEGQHSEAKFRAKHNQYMNIESWAYGMTQTLEAQGEHNLAYRARMLSQGRPCHGMASRVMEAHRAGENVTRAQACAAVRVMREFQRGRG